MTNLVSHTAIRDGHRLYGWCFDPASPGQSRQVQVIPGDGSPIAVAAKGAIPEWAWKQIRSRNPELSDDVLRQARGFFQISLGQDAVAGYAQVVLRDVATDQPLTGSPVVAWHGVSRTVGMQDRRYVSLEDEALQDLSFHELVALVRERQAAGQMVVAQPPFISWNISLFQRPQHMAVSIARAGALFVYFSDGHRDTRREIVRHGDNLIIVAMGSAFFERFLEEVRDVHFVFYSTLPQDLIGKLNDTGQRVIYEYVDHIDPKISASWLDGCLRNWYGLSDNNTYGVVATARLLHEEVLTRFDPQRVALIPNGVNRSHFRHGRDRGTIPPSYREIVDRKRPLVGYYGAIAPWLDYRIVAELAALCPDVDFVYIGPLYLKEQADLPVAPNLFWYGPVPYSELPHYAAWFDLSIIPFEEGDIASTTSPLKLFEYFEIGRPVVVTSWMLECVQFPIVRHGRSAAELAARIRAGLASWTDADIAASRALAAEHDWQRRAEDFVAFLERLGGLSPPAGTAVQTGDIFVASAARNLIAGGLSSEIRDDRITLAPAEVAAGPGGELVWRLKLPRPAPVDSVLEFDFGFSLGGTDAGLTLDMSSGDESLRFPVAAAGEGSSDLRRIRLPFEAGQDGITLHLRTHADLQLDAENTTFRFERFRWLSSDAALYCNAAPVVRNAHLPQPAQPRHESIMEGARLQRVSGHMSHEEQMIRAPVTLPAGPLLLSLPDRPATGDLAELLVEPDPACVLPDHHLRLRLCSPHFNPSATGRVIYYVACGADVVYFEDICLFSGLNELVVPVAEQIRIGILCCNNDAGWQWRDLSRIELFDIELLEPQSGVRPGASSPAGTDMLGRPQPLAGFRADKLAQSAR